MCRIAKFRVQLVREGSTEYPIDKFIECSKDITDIMNSLPEYQEGVEIFSVIHLDGKHKIIWVDPLFKGTINSTVVYPSEVVKRALLCNASAVVLCHNHPSGNPTPSSEDRRVTTQIQEACKLFDIAVLDHIILGDNVVFSFADRGLL